MKQAKERVRRRWWRRLRLPLLVLLCYLVPVGVGLMNPSVPFDIAVNLMGTTHDDALEVAGTDAVERVRMLTGLRGIDLEQSEE